VYAAGRSAAPEAEVASLFAEARRELGDVDSRSLAMTLSGYSIVRNAAGHVAEAHGLSDEALAMARRLGDSALLAAILATRTTIFASQEFPDEHVSMVAEIERLCANDLALGEELIGFRPWPTAFGMGLSMLIRSGRGNELEAFVARARALLGDCQNAIEQVSFHFRSGLVRSLRGDASGALEHGRQALEWGMRSQNLFIRVVAHAARARGLLGAGRADEALEQLEQALVLAIDRAQGGPFAAAEVFPLLAQTQLRRGDVGAARTAAERGVELARRFGFRHAVASNEILLASARIAGGDAAGAEAALAHALELATALAARDLPPLIEEARAELAQLRSDAAGCEQALRTAARMHRENGEEWLATQAEARLDK
jgi:ATP/maltotriose-dependent transcriptional regulator MalT